MSQNPQGNITKQRILECAANLFAEKGFTETTIRELTKAVGLKNPASFYHHFESKNAILEFMLEDYALNNTDVFENRNIGAILREKPTVDGIMACLQTSFPSDKVEYYVKVLCVMLQEQLRNPIVCKHMSEQVILRSEVNSGKIIIMLKELGIIRNDVDPDYWTKIISSLFYSFATRMMLGIGDNSPVFSGKGMEELLRETFRLMLELGRPEETADPGRGEVSG